MIRLDADHGGLSLLLPPKLDATITELCRAEIHHLGDCLASWGRFSHPVRVVSVATMAQLAREASAPVDGLLCAVAEPRQVTLLQPSSWLTVPGQLTLRTTLTHELAHSLLFQRCAPQRLTAIAIPTWFREGMAVLVSEGRPTATQRRRVDGRLSFSALASADAVLIGEQAASCYDIAHLLFCRWHDQYGDRKFTALCRQMRLGNGFDRGFGQVCGLSMADWLQTTIGDLRSELTDELS